MTKEEYGPEIWWSASAIVLTCLKLFWWEGRVHVFFRYTQNAAKSVHFSRPLFMFSLIFFSATNKGDKNEAKNRKNWVPSEYRQKAQKVIKKNTFSVSVRTKIQPKTTKNYILFYLRIRAGQKIMKTAPEKVVGKRLSNSCGKHDSFRSNNSPHPTTKGTILRTHNDVKEE